MKYPVKSRYRIVGLLAIILPNLLWGFLTWTLFSETDFMDRETWMDSSLLFLLFLIGGLQLILMILLMTQCSYIIVTESMIRFINPLLPFISKTFYWSDFDYYHSIEEYSKYQSYKAIWIIKDGKIKKRISSFYYTNFATIFGTIKTPYKGKLKMNIIKQAYCLLGGHI
jgi:hypothetical protein